jgi:hypothetical protein
LNLQVFRVPPYSRRCRGHSLRTSGRAECLQYHSNICSNFESSPLSVSKSCTYYKNTNGEGDEVGKNDIKNSPLPEVPRKHAHSFVWRRRTPEGEVRFGSPVPSFLSCLPELLASGRTPRHVLRCSSRSQYRYSCIPGGGNWQTSDRNRSLE